MNLTLIGSGTGSYKMRDFEGNIFWMYLPSYQEFLIYCMTNKSVIIEDSIWKSLTFSDKLVSVASKIVLLTQDDTERIQGIEVARNLEIAISHASDKHENISVFGDCNLSNSLLSRASDVRYMKVDIQISDNGDRFPHMNDDIFKKISYMCIREDTPKEMFVGLERAVTVASEIQHWFRKKKITQSK